VYILALKDALLNIGSLALASFVIAYAARAGYRVSKESFGADTEELVDPATDQQIVNNYGDIQKVSTERGIMNGQAVGQTLNHSMSGPYEQIMWGPDLSAYVMSVSASYPSFGQNYTGAAVGAN
tara:strand:- start:2 stop:373 length:372 start_codon:yes stop_codon:yes gene_type:complete